MNIPEDVYSNLTDEQKKRVEAAGTAEELVQIALEKRFRAEHRSAGLRIRRRRLELLRPLMQ